MEYFKAGTANYAGWTIPAYYALSFVPHIYAGALLKAPTDIAKRRTDGKVKPGQLIYSMANPRGAGASAKYEGVLDKSTFARWERCRAAHNNMLETSGFVVSAFLLGFITKVPAESMNLASAIYLSSRILYMISYIGFEKGPAIYLRTLWFFVGIGALISLWSKAAAQILDGKY